MWDIVWISPQGHRSVSVSCHFLLQALQCSVVTVQDFAFPVGFDRFLTPNFG